MTLDHDPIDTAWRTHDALKDWTGRVDSKASFALTIESALLAAVVSLSAPGRRLGRLRTPSQVWSYRMGVFLLACGVVAAVAAVIPQLGARRTKADFGQNFIYFGHVRHWDPSKLAKYLQAVNILPVLTRQLVTMGKISWRKHRLLQVSLLLAVIGAAFLGWAIRAGAR